MTVYLSCYPGKIVVQCPAASEDGAIVATLRKVVRPGGDFRGLQYDELARLGSGRHELFVEPPAAEASED